MFDFLKKKLKIFEKNIEAEIESELKKDAKLEKRLQAILEITEFASVPVAHKEKHR